MFDNFRATVSQYILPTVLKTDFFRGYKMEIEMGNKRFADINK